MGSLMVAYETSKSFIEIGKERDPKILRNIIIDNGKMALELSKKYREISENSIKTLIEFLQSFEKDE